MHDEMIIVSPLSFSNKTAVSAFAGVLLFWSVTNSTPTIKPLPLTSPMTGTLHNNYENNKQNCGYMLTMTNKLSGSNQTMEIPGLYKACT
jgi:hypothetical protein